MALSWLADREYNEKCVVISGAAVTAYALLPPRRLWVGVGIAVASYVLVAWYDELYDCEERLVARGGLFGALTGPMKPPVSNGTYGGGMAGPEPPC